MMAYQRGVSVSVLDQSNKPFREFSESGQRTARLESGQEYKLRIKNKTGKRAYVRVNIDGTDVLTGSRSFVMKPYEELDLERFVDDLNTGRRFKFLSIDAGTKTGEIQDPSNPLNGRVRVSIWPELEMPLVSTQLYQSSPFTWTTSGAPQIKGVDMVNDSYRVNSCTNERAMSTNDIGATAEGGVSNQQFGSSHEFFLTETPFDIDIWLRVAGAQTSKAWEFRPTSTGAIVSYKDLILGGVAAASIENGSMVLRIPIGEVNLRA